MKRILIVCLIAAAAGLGAAPVAQAKKTVIKIATLAPDGSSWDKILRQMTDDWKGATEGRVEVRIYPGGVAGDDPDIVRKMRIGQLQGAALTVGGLSSIEPGFNVFSIPLFFDSFDEFLYVREKLTPVLSSGLEKNGFKMMNWGHGGWAHLFLTKKVATLDELKKVKMWTWAGDDRIGEIWKKVGFNPVPLAATDLLTGLQTGLIDAMPTTPYAALAMQWYRQTPYLLDAGFAPLVGATVISMKTWENLDPADATVMLDIAHDPKHESTAEIADTDREAIGEMEKRGVTLIHVDLTQGEWKQAADQFADEMRKAIVPQDVFELALKYRSEYRSGHPSGGSN